jgi:hypothetical protein
VRDGQPVGIVSMGGRSERKASRSVAAARVLSDQRHALATHRAHGRDAGVLDRRKNAW